MEEAAKENRIEASQNYIKLPKWLVILAVLVMMIIIAAGFFLLGLTTQTSQHQASKITSVPTQFPTPTIASVSPTGTLPTFPTSSNPNVARFTSQKLGISFTYLKTEEGQAISAKEINDKVYVYFDNSDPTTGQYIQVMPKDKNQTLEQAIKFLILNGYSTTDCVLKTVTQNIPVGIEAMSITVPINPNDDQATIEAKASKCPQAFTAMGGISYFLEDPNHPDRMFFLSIGQYAITSENGNVWQSTIQVF